jgi:hypothetical protein
MKFEYFKAKIRFYAKQNHKESFGEFYDSQEVKANTLENLLKRIEEDFYISSEKLKKDSKKEENLIYRDDKDNNPYVVGFISNIGWELPYNETKKVFELRVIEITKVIEEVVNLSEIKKELV